MVDTISGREQRLIGKVHKDIMIKMIDDLAAENSKQLDYIRQLESFPGLTDRKDKITHYMAQWKDGVEGQARVLNKYKPIGFDLGIFYHKSGWEGPHPDHG
jgi:hypothetical protein